ncbi:hypothetical protein GPECTOR_4g562 [Gonium pectorale]|uniref:Uncharacterized protein n=1 Tax=Gonium pectorale TaxID=33097 RepID=A0A150GX87_GONPE|nr:hypothetical protein GPECTOR_4g562 [Gonium pectorale]|eukprot:KXZ54497.1 hypothetical protein GPECTOR_4g562 [Gonium pectorale]
MTISEAPPPIDMEWRDYRHLPPRYKTTLEALRALSKARLMSEHEAAARHLDVEVDWDAPTIKLQGRDAMRSALYGLKWLLSSTEIKPVMYKLHEVDSKRSRLEVMVQIVAAPHRPWWLPVTWLLPRAVELKGVFQLRVSKGAAPDGSEDVITSLHEQLLNIPTPPAPLRLLSGALLGYLPSASQGLWAPIVGIFADPSLRSQGPSLIDRAKEAAEAAGERVQGAVTSAVDTVGGGAATAADTTRNVAGAAAGKAAGAADAAAGAADTAADRLGNGGGLAGKMAGAAQEAVHSAAGVVKEGAEGAVEKVAAVAQKTKKKSGGGRA